MFDQIYEKIKSYDNIVIVRHIGADPDALCCQTALRDSIKLTFPKKKVLATGTTSNRFNYLPKLDKFEELNDTLLIVVDTPDKKRVDFSWNIDVAYSIKIDHHPHMETFCDIEYIEEESSSASQIILELIFNTPLKINDDIANNIYTGIISDTNRFMFNSNSKVFGLISKLFNEYAIDTSNIYEGLYNRPINEVRIQGYISQNLKITENGFAYIRLTNDILNEFKVDVGSAGNMINNFYYMEGVYVWAIVSDDIKNNIYKANIRSRGPVINKIAEKYNGGGHKMASGARILEESQIEMLFNDLDNACKEYKDKMGVDLDED
ncbi:MAG: bifunctional oligoribonuclease/PAP phosphatase NrnA [bacterium]|nr:bifunctional oligoribonuclease/PAP phosphatase NrnA [bacterium]